MNLFLTLTSILVLVYFVIIQLVLLALAVVSGFSLYRDRLKERFGRSEDMLASDLAPPVSIVIAAYNEAAGIVESIRSMAMVSYPRFEIVVTNDGSDDDTLQRLIEAFEMIPVPFPVRANIATAPILQVYKSTLPIPLTVVDKENGGKSDALNAAINASRYPYVLATDADVLIDGHALIHAMRLVAEDREKVVAVGGNVRPINGCRIRHGHVVEAELPESLVERHQLLEYLRAFVASRPAWSTLNCLPILSGAFGIFRRDVVAEVGGFTVGHLGEDLDLTMRIHRHMRRLGRPYRILYAPRAVVWTEVPVTRQILRRQRIRWHRGLLTAVKDFRSTLFNPRHGTVGMISWPVMVLFEVLAPVVEFMGWVVIPLAVLVGAVSLSDVLVLFLLALLLGAITSLVALLLDERYGYFNNPKETFSLLALVFVENLGLRQVTVWWRIRAMLGGLETRAWGNMERKGATALARKAG
jgi:cellulose synthase/poly-beta-1,6-N-acetylglucosamine synthase-like glycosyltransferase